jgi:hypothetical protein
MTIRRLVALAAAGGSLAAVAACSASAHSAAPGSTGSTCGTTRTGANVPVVIKVSKGSVTCTDVMRVEIGYAAAIKAGKVAGNGGGAPVQVSGWTCQGYPTPEVLQTGNASECHTASAEVVAVVELPSSSSGS